MLVEINTTIDKFNSDLKKLFGSRLLDIIIYGSSVRGGFNAQTSDIDFIVFVSGTISKDDISSIIYLHEEYRKSSALKKLLEGKYIGIESSKMSNGYYVGTSRKGWKEINQFGSDYIEQAMILDSYYSIYSSNLLPSVITSDFNNVKKDILSQIDNFIVMDILGRDQGFTEYACIASARSLYTFINEKFISKQEALIWLEQNYFVVDFDYPLEYIKKIKSLML